ncbi:hypothetical protein [Amycolatopsis sp. cg13]
MPITQSAVLRGHVLTSLVQPRLGHHARPVRVFATLIYRRKHRG